MSQMAYRWEWRTFGSGLPAAEACFAKAATVGEPQETEETYLLGPEAVNVKIRFDLLDVKTLRDTDDHGLQLWAPVKKTEFPMSKEAASEIFGLWGVNAPSLERDTYTRDQFLDELVSPDADLVIAEVNKKRTRYSIDGCMSEMTTLSVGGRSAKTAAVESEDPAAAMRVVEKLGLSGHVNTSYNRGLRCLLGLSPARYAVVDIGTNSVKFHIGEQKPDGSWIRVVDRAEVTRLGEGLNDTGEIQSEALERTVRAVEGMVDEARANEVLAIAAVGTAALRIASNSPLAVTTVVERAGVPVEVVSGEEESRLAYLAVSRGVGVADGEVVVFDTGGGSTQFTFGRGGGVTERYSLNLGAVTYTERFGLDKAVDDATVEKARSALSHDLDSLDDRGTPDALVGMGGAMTNITAVSLALGQYDPDVVQGAIITREEVERQIEMYRAMGQEERRGTIGLQANRAPVILAGALVVATVMAKLGRESLLVSDRGLRHGLIQERFGLFSAS